MIEKTRKRKKGVITEGDISTLLQRYPATTILALLQEVAQFEGVRIDWNELVRKTSTGISNAKEYQMLWRHLAYQHTLLPKIEDGDQPLDDDSDLEFELESFPEVNTEASAEAAACVKVLIASGLPCDSGNPNSSTVEAPLTINIPNGQSLKVTSELPQPAVMRGMNITVPVSVQKQPLPAVASSEGLDTIGLGSGTSAAKRRRKWSKDEDEKLKDGVQKYGEGNWATILRGDFTWDRTASQLSQRWAIIKKRPDVLNMGSNSSGLHLSEAQEAARNALKVALGSPAKNITKNRYGKPQMNLKSTSATPNVSSDPVRATAVAAGARIATQSDAASLLKAAQAKNAIHIMPRGGSMKSPIPAGAPNHLDSPNVHFISTGRTAAPPLATTNPPASSSGSSLGSAKAPPPTAQHTNPPTLSSGSSLGSARAPPPAQHTNPPSSSSGSSLGSAKAPPPTAQHTNPLTLSSGISLGSARAPPSAQHTNPPSSSSGSSLGSAKAPSPTARHTNPPTSSSGISLGLARAPPPAQHTNPPSSSNGSSLGSAKAPPPTARHTNPPTLSSGASLGSAKAPPPTSLLTSPPMSFSGASLGSAKAPPPTALLTNPPMSSSGASLGLAKAPPPTAQHTPVTSGASTAHNNTKLASQEDAKVAGSIEVSGLGIAKEQVQENGGDASVNASSKQVEEDKAILRNQEAESEDKIVARNDIVAQNNIVVENHNISPKPEMVEDEPVDAISNKADGGSEKAEDNKPTSSSVKEGRNESAVEESGEKQTGSEKAEDNKPTSSSVKEGEDQSAVEESGEKQTGSEQAELASMVTDQCGEQRSSQSDSTQQCKNVDTET